jgi:hypothetical protein
MTGKEEWFSEIGEEKKVTNDEFVIKENSNNVNNFNLACFYQERY